MVVKARVGVFQRHLHCTCERLVETALKIGCTRLGQADVEHRRRRSGERYKGTIAARPESQRRRQQPLYRPLVRAADEGGGRIDSGAQRLGEACAAFALVAARCDAVAIELQVERDLLTRLRRRTLEAGFEAVGGSSKQYLERLWNLTGRHAEAN